jgi:methylglutaconyl-CoA hydratase
MRLLESQERLFTACKTLPTTINPLMDTLKITTTGWVQTITLDRAEARNAFNETMIAELREAFTAIRGDIRAIVLTGSGSAFCAGADVNWMRDSAKRSEPENQKDATRMEAMFRAIDECPAPVIGKINGVALGGGMGLVACCDIAVAADTAQFGFTEVRLGIVPAVISPYSLAKIGQSEARRYFLTGELFGADQARAMGLVHEVVPDANLDESITRLTDALSKNGPNAVRTAKQLIREVSAMSRDEARQHTIATIARVRTFAEGQDGLSAFLEKRKPGWMEN